MGETNGAGTHAGSSATRGSQVGIVFSATARALRCTGVLHVTTVISEVFPPEFSAQQILKEFRKVLEPKMDPEIDLLGGRVPKLWTSPLAGSILELSKVTMPEIL